MKRLFAVILLLGSGAAAAETARQLVETYSHEAASQIANFRPSAHRGGAFFAKNFGVSEKMPACTACHTENPTQAGRHAVTGKDIKPLAPTVNGERFTDAAKVEKWFRRNCKEVVGRECTPAEKADFVQFLAEAR